MKKKLKLESIEVKSFVTDLSKAEKETVEGGTTVIATPTPAIYSAIADITAPLLVSAAVGASIVITKKADPDNSVPFDQCPQPACSGALSTCSQNPAGSVCPVTYTPECTKVPLCPGSPQIVSNTTCY